MSKGSTTVDAPDPIEIARADARFNRIDQYTPFANFTYSGPDRNQATLQLNPFLAGNENRRMFSDRMMLDMALGRQMAMNQGGLPALTRNISPGALNEYFGLPSALQGGSDLYNNVPNVPDITGQENAGAKGGGLPSAPPGGPSIPGGKGGFGGKPQAQPTSPNVGGGAKGMQRADPAAGFQGGAIGPGQFGGGSKGGNTTSSQLQWVDDPSTHINVPGALGGPPAQGGGGAKGTQRADPAAGFQGGAIGPGQFGGGSKGGGGGTVYDGGDWGMRGEPLTDRARQMVAQEQGGGGLFGGTVGGMIDPETFGQIGSLDQLQDFDLDRGRVEQALYDRQVALLQPELDQQEQRTISNLRARGIPRGSEAWDREVEGMRKNRMLQYGNIANQATLAGGGEQSRLFGISSALGDRSMLGQRELFNMADMLAQRDIQAQLQNANIAASNRATQFNELASLLGLQQVASPQLSNFFAPGQADVTGAYALNQQAQAGNAQRSADMKGGVMEGLTTLGGAAMMSDRRLKKNVKRIGSINGYPLYEFDYIWGEHSVGVMSDEVPAEFVSKHPSGYDMVDYARIF